MSEQLTKELEKLLANMEKVGASDLHLKVGSPAIYRVHGTPQRLKGEPYTFGRLNDVIFEVMTPEQQENFKKNGSLDFALGVAGVGRFRVNVFMQRGAMSFCARRVNTDIPDFDSLMLPKAINRIPAMEDGLVLVVGVTGSGKSTTLASIINKINQSRRAHILTIEDPIEYVYRDDKSFINQREVGTDVGDFHSALKYALRQDPDVILVGEMRDIQTVETAISAAETGHLVLGTLHATNALQTVSRILEFFGPDRQPGIRQVLSYTLRAIVGQRLLPGATKEHPRVPAVEIMFVNSVIRKYLADGEDFKIPDAIRADAQGGMQDFNMSLYKLVNSGLVSKEHALERSPNPEQLEMQLKGMVLNTDKSAM
ncbi:MAG: PilT/PilU family type 4a pilus ATPase [Planctomycetes bacterium]|nr:PilT/PilU family type 4a pilus ATPase [Planctomycetota bacterium]